MLNFNITEFRVAEDHLSLHGEGDLLVAIINKVVLLYRLADEGYFVIYMYATVIYHFKIYDTYMCLVVYFIFKITV